MTDRTEQRALVFCHACENEWHQDEHGLECPNCQSRFVEIIEENHDPRQNHSVQASDFVNDRERSDTIHDRHHMDVTRNSDDEHYGSHQLPRLHTPPRYPDPDEDDIENVAFNPAPGVHFQHTTIRTSSPMNREGHVNNPMASMLQGFAIFTPPGQSSNMVADSSPTSRNMADGLAQLPHLRIQRYPHGEHVPFSTMQHGPPNVFTANIRFTPASGNNGDGIRNDRNGDSTMDNIHTVMQTMLAQLASNARPNVGVRPGVSDESGAAEMNPFEFIRQAITQIVDPGNARHGDAVYTEEAFDRIISQMMDQNGEGSAPGPASPAAIAALPRQKVVKTMLGSDGKAECSVCMDEVSIGEEVMMLPCKHWFHEECVGAWLREHDTCPHCRRSITSGNDTSSQEPPQSHQTHMNTYYPPINVPSEIHHNLPQQPQTPLQGRPIHLNQAQPFIPGGFPSYPEPPPNMRHRQLPAPFVSSPTAQSTTTPMPPRRHSSREHPPSEGGSSSTSSGSRIGGWFRNLRPGSSER